VYKRQVAFQHWRLGAISEGVRVRYAAGAMGDQEGTADGDARDGIDYLLSGAETWLAQA